MSQEESVQFPFVGLPFLLALKSYAPRRTLLRVQDHLHEDKARLE